MDSAGHPLLLFDGVCNLCSGAVQFIIRRDPQAHFRFASQQSAVGQRYLAELGIDRTVTDSLILVEGGRWFKESEAVLRLLLQLGGAWRAVTVLRLIPRPIRDWVYRRVAFNRYRWFGRKETCWLPSPDLRRRFLD